MTNVLWVLRKTVQYECKELWFNKLNKSYKENFQNLKNIFMSFKIIFVIVVYNFSISRKGRNINYTY